MVARTPQEVNTQFFSNHAVWEAAAKAAGCTIERRFIHGNHWPQHWVARAADGVAIGKFERTEQEFYAPRGYLMHSSEAALAELQVVMHVKSKLLWGVTVTGKLGEYVNGYAILADSGRHIARLPSEIRTITGNDILYEDAAVQITAYGGPM
jgi:hypothetical protein